MSRARPPPNFASRYCLDVCTSKACDANGDCPALDYRREQAVAARLGEIAVWLATHGPATAAEIAAGCGLGDVPRPDTLPAWQRGYLVERWERALAACFRRADALFERPGGGAARWRVPQEPLLHVVAREAGVRLPEVDPTAAAVTAAAAALDAAARPLSIADVAAACGLDPAAPAWSDRVEALTRGLEQLGRYRCVAYDPVSGIGWRWCRADLVPEPRVVLPAEPNLGAAPSVARSDARTAVTVRRRHVAVGMLPLDARGRALFPDRPRPAYVEIREEASGVVYPAWYDPATGCIDRLDDFYLMNAVPYGAQVDLWPLDAPSMYAARIGQVDEIAAERDMRARLAGGRRPGRPAEDLNPFTVLGADVQHLRGLLAADSDADARLAARVDQVEAALVEMRSAQ